MEPEGPGAAPSMQAKGGGDEPESLLDAIFLLAKEGVSGIQDSEDQTKCTFPEDKKAVAH